MYNENISTVARYPNPNLKWEETRQFNVELDLSFLDNRIGINGTLYLKKTEDCFTTVQVSSVNGVPGHSYVMNGGNLENNGYSVGLSGVPVKTRDWQWNLYTYFSGNLNKVRSQTVEKYTIDSYLNGTALVDGEAVSSFYSYRFLGLNPANGVPVFNDYADRMHLLEDRELEDIVLMTMEKSGQRDPIFTGSLSTSLTYKSLSLSVNMSYSLGSKVRLFSLYEPILNGVSAEKNIRKEFVNRWMAPGDELNTNVPVILSPSDPDYFSSLVLLPCWVYIHFQVIPHPDPIPISPRPYPGSSHPDSHSEPISSQPIQVIYSFSFYCFFKKLHSIGKYTKALPTNWVLQNQPATDPVPSELLQKL